MNLPYLTGVIGDAYSIDKADIPDYLNNPAFVESLDVWWFWSQKGTLPYSGGIYEQPKQVKEVLQLFENSYNAYNAYKRRRA